VLLLQRPLPIKVFALRVNTGVKHPKHARKYLRCDRTPAPLLCSVIY
jgi:hypothetical protein